MSTQPFTSQLWVNRVPAYWQGLRRGAFTCVGWQVTLCDPISQVTSRSCEMGVSLTAILSFAFFYLWAWGVVASLMISVSCWLFRRSVYYVESLLSDCFLVRSVQLTDCFLHSDMNNVIKQSSTPWRRVFRFLSFYVFSVFYRDVFLPFFYSIYFVHCVRLSQAER